MADADQRQTEANEPDLTDDTDDRETAAEAPKGEQSSAGDLPEGEAGDGPAEEVREPTDEQEPEELSPEAEIATLKAQAAELIDKHLRAVADLDNARKRARREQQEERRYANAGLMTELLPVIDNFERALDSSQSEAGEAQLREGVELIRKQLQQVLERHGLSAIPALHEKFDPMKHEALGHMESDEAEPGCIAMETVRGYLLHDRVLRASQVFVAAEPPEEQAGETGEGVSEERPEESLEEPLEKDAETAHGDGEAETEGS